MVEESVAESFGIEGGTARLASEPGSSSRRLSLFSLC